MTFNLRPGKEGRAVDGLKGKPVQGKRTEGESSPFETKSLEAAILFPMSERMLFHAFCKPSWPVDRNPYKRILRVMEAG